VIDLAKALLEGRGASLPLRIVSSRQHERSNPPNAFALLSARRERPRRRRAAEQRDERAPFHGPMPPVLPTVNRIGRPAVAPASD
jgi:hypothetical protein